MNTRKNTPHTQPNEQVSALPYSLIDYLANVERAESTVSERVINTAKCGDSNYIPKVKNAGNVLTDERNRQFQVMHNGLKVAVDGYYGEWTTQVIKELKGHHEPQEEKVFHEVLKRVSPDSWMIELGAYWSYYSLWFHKAIARAHNVCCEPDAENLKIGELNANLNSYSDMTFINAAAGRDDGKSILFKSDHKVSTSTVKVRSVDSLMDEYEINRLEILHMDIQGAELDALKGAEKAIKNGKLRFVFVSTHHYLISRNPNIHQDCIDYINSMGGHIIAEHEIHESFSGDGLIVASFDAEDSDFTVEVSRNCMTSNSFRPYTKDLELSFQAYDYILNRVVSKNSQLEKMSNQLRDQEILLRNYKKSIDHLNNLHIPAALKELFKSIKRSLKSRVTRVIWGKKSIYQPTEDLVLLAKKETFTREDVEAAIATIEKNDSVNLMRLIEEPSPYRMAAYEFLRHASHLPRRIIKRIRRGTKK